MCTLDRSVRDTVTQLKIRRRGCRAGAHCRQRRLAAMTSSGCSTNQAEGIPVITGKRRSADTSVNININSRTCSARRHRRSALADEQRRRPQCLVRVPLQQRSTSHVSNVQLSTRQTPACPSLYVLNAAAMTKPHAIEHLAADLLSYNTDVAIITETHLKSKHHDNVTSNQIKSNLFNKRTTRPLSLQYKQVNTIN